MFTSGLAGAHAESLIEARLNEDPNGLESQHHRDLSAPRPIGRVSYPFYFL
jgi:hypothetical protein